MTPINVPERNRAIKKLLQATYPAYGASIKVKAGDGSARHWVYVTFEVKPDELAHCRTYAQVCDAIITLCRANSICLNVTLPHQVRP